MIPIPVKINQLYFLHLRHGTTIKSIISIIIHIIMINIILICALTRQHWCFNSELAVQILNTYNIYFLLLIVKAYRPFERSYFVVIKLLMFLYLYNVNM